MLYLFEDYIFDTKRRELRRGTTAVTVEPQVFDLIAYLIANRERVVSKEELRTAVWKGRMVSESTLSSCINAARTAIGDSGVSQRLIRTLQRKGFRFVGPVREEQTSAAPASEGRGTAGEPGAAAGEQHRDDAPPTSWAPRFAGLLRALPMTPATLAVSGVAVVAVALGALLWSAPRSSPTVTPGRRFDASSVPLVDDEDRKTLATYPNRPDIKALAIGTDGMAVADAQPNTDAAKQEALRGCNARSTRPCQIYGVGMGVVWPKDALPLPAPADIRFEPLEAPLVPEEIPTLSRYWQRWIANNYMKGHNHKALALTTGGHLGVGARGTRAEAVRLAIERCAERWQRPCLLLAVDGLLTIRIPKSRHIVRIFLPSTEAGIPAHDRERIVRIYQGVEWRALAKGQTSWHAVAAAPSEATAIETALRSCSQADRECRLYAIGNFHVAEQ